MVHSFLLIGQSNMAGRGFLHEVQPIRDARIRVLRNGRWQTMWEPIHFDRPFAGIGLGASFAKRWLEDHPDEEIGLIPCADGGSSLEEWQPGSELFDHAVFQVQLARRSSILDGILWHQGENDCTQELIDVYPEKFRLFLEGLREALGARDIPFLIGGMGDYLVDCDLYNDFTKTPLMNETLFSLADACENCLFVSARGLTSNPDLLHLNAASQRKFGLRYYEALHTGCHVRGPVKGEEEQAVSAGAYQAMSLKAKAALLKKDLDAGIITKQEYDMRAADLVRQM
jgi:hypothetical protein